MNLLSTAAAEGHLNGTAPSTSQIILETASKFVKSSSGNSSSISMDTVISQISNGISTNMVCNLIKILVIITLYMNHIYIYIFCNLTITYYMYIYRLEDKHPMIVLQTMFDYERLRVLFQLNHHLYHHLLVKQRNYMVNLKD